ncbi:MAG: L-threonylcarbamoyladenylate synthase [Candidatus Hadarchaeales archaeon]
MTEVLKVNPLRPEKEVIERAAEIIRRGGIVAFPTETVYGLGANALDENAVRKVFEVKQRPADNPLIVHISRLDDLYLLASEVPEIANKLVSSFWPGPLTIVLPRSEIVPDVTTGGLWTVAIRMPSHPVARALIEASEVPIAAPSANLAGKPSPTSASHVFQDLGGKIDMILDGGEIIHGVESTVLDLTTSPPTLLRPGPVSVEELEALIGKVSLHPVVVGESEEVLVAKSPGMKYRHYAPEAELVVIEGRPELVRRKMEEILLEKKMKGLKVGAVVTDEMADLQVDVVKVVGSRKNVREIAKNIFRVLRELDAEGVRFAVIEGIEPKGIGLAVMNRLVKAAGHRVIRV